MSLKTTTSVTMSPTAVFGLAGPVMVNDTAPVASVRPISEVASVWFPLWRPSTSLLNVRTRSILTLRRAVATLPEVASAPSVNWQEMVVTAANFDTCVATAVIWVFAGVSIVHLVSAAAAVAATVTEL